jgi:hypothetical protein
MATTGLLKIPMRWMSAMETETPILMKIDDQKSGGVANVGGAQTCGQVWPYSIDG